LGGSARQPIAYHYGIIHLQPKKVQSFIRGRQNGAIALIDNLETSIIKSAPFAASFLKIILNFQKSLNAPFGVSF